MSDGGVMAEFSFDTKSMLRDGKRWFPIMGEIHYSRYPEQYWKEALLKMKEGGVDLISSYVIWIHQEEVENEYDWSGQRNLRKFVEIIRDCGLLMILRIGPWSHGEVRNGGFPDWLLKKCPDARKTNDDRYFREVEKFYKAVYEQVKGLLLKDGGPIIGVQIDNEYGHCGGLKGEEGERHMLHLKELACATGFDVPIYTATGWGGAITAGMLPVMGGYCEAPWDARITEIEPSGNFVFTYERNDHAIGSDLGTNDRFITFDPAKFPYLTAELGGGIQPTFKRRPVAWPRDIGAMSLAKLGSGCNLLGYYMYHGGQNPEGRLTTLEENTATGYPNDLCIKNYDFRAPLGEYGVPCATYGEIKLYTLFIQDFGESFAATDTSIPKDNPVEPDNFTDLRTSWRYTTCPDCGKKTGYVFVNNYQRRRMMAAHNSVVLKSDDAGAKFPAVDIANGDFFFLPFNMKVAGGLLRTSLATPLCVLNNARPAYVFYSAAAPSGGERQKESTVCASRDAPASLYQFEGAVPDCDIVTLSREDALNAHKVISEGCVYLVVTNATLYQEKRDGKTAVHLQSDEAVSFMTYPQLKKTPDGFKAEGTKSGFTLYTSENEAPAAPKVSFKKTDENDKTVTYTLSSDAWSDSLEDVFIDIRFDGNCARLFEGGRLIDDALFLGRSIPWTVGLKRYGRGAHEFTLEIDALAKGAPIFLEDWPDFGSTARSVKRLVSVGVRAQTESVFEV